MAACVALRVCVTNSCRACACVFAVLGKLAHAHICCTRRLTLSQSFFKYSYEALMANEFRGETFTCTNTSDTTAATQCITTGEQVLQVYGMTDVVRHSRSWVVLLCVYAAV